MPRGLFESPFLPAILGIMEIRRVHASEAPRPGGHYAHAVVCNGLVFVSGQLSIDPKTGEKRFGTIEEQTELALGNVERILKASGSDLEHVLKMMVYVADIRHWDAVNTVFGRVLGERRCARTVIPTGTLHYGFLVEIDAVAATT